MKFFIALMLILLSSGCATTTRDVSETQQPNTSLEELQKDKEKLDQTKDLLKY